MPRPLVSDIDDAGDEAALCAAVERARESVTPGPRWSEAVRHALTAAARLVTSDRAIGWTWLVSGSVGRGEAIPLSDVETLLVLDESTPAPAAMSLAADTHALLQRCGLVADPNGVLASRARFCRRTSDWATGIERWCANPTADRGSVMIGLLADSGPSPDLRALTARTALRHYPVRHTLLEDATAVRATLPSRLRVLATQADTVDVKLAALEPVVKIARWAALSAGSDELDTAHRLTVAEKAGILDPDDASSLRECFGWITKLRWKIQSDNVSLARLAPQDRAMLRGVAREIAGIRRKLTYLSSTSSFR